MERNFPVIPIFRKRGCTQNVFLNFRKLFPEFLPFHSVSDRKSRYFWSNGKRPWSQRFFLIFHRMGELRESSEAAYTSREAARDKEINKDIVAPKKLSQIPVARRACQIVRTTFHRFKR